ncbi:alpha-ribazole phosphatase [Reichenbachiella carrageenanivorans]|uniref:Alpha-ribazole phosphatase n=1 Tax=Reichenbachiella carrageenanivorans TaxID=2979869 RepID=A0ABY6CVZ9_9BACT|nr:alpha-ribazole phosphatase [Reichenbachiella carrageenanivorans]UXX78081.1 alpha-ribazole phosphatase [Reichenbachiella carrageenanivorans]
MEIYLIRHTTPKIEPGVCYGQSDLALTAQFESESQQVHQNIDKPFDYIFSSPLKRCTQLANTFETTVQQENRLMELNFGDWEMKKWKSIPQSALNLWMEKYVTQGPPKGESYEQLKSRVVEIFKGIISQNRTCTGIITHAGPIRAILSHVLNLSLKDTFTIKIDYGSVTKISLNDATYSIDYINKK